MIITNCNSTLRAIQRLVPSSLGWPDRRRGKGKRGGLRVIYYYLASDTQVWLMAVYDKDEAADLSPAERRMLKTAIDEELRQRADIRRVREK